MILHELLGKVSDKTRISIYFAGTLSDYASRREVPARLWNCEVVEISVYEWKLNVEVRDNVKT